jgi:hypothetical protein
MAAPFHSFGLAVVALALAGCAAVDPASHGAGLPHAGSGEGAPEAVRPGGSFDGWTQRTFAGKRPTRYRVVEVRDHPSARHAVRAEADRSASLFRRQWPAGQPLPPSLRFSWRIERLISTANLRDRDAEDSPVRVVLAFDGPTNTLPLRERMFFDLAEAVTGERPPYATLMYVWDRHADVGAVIPSNSTSRIRKIVVDGRDSPVGPWRFHERAVETDFRAAFGEAPGRLMAVGVMTDSDNTGYRIRAWYGPLEWGEAAGPPGGSLGPAASP